MTDQVVPVQSYREDGRVKGTHSAGDTYSRDTLKVVRMWIFKRMARSVYLNHAFHIKRKFNVFYI